MEIVVIVCHLHRFKTMGTPAPDILQQVGENNFTGTATLSVLDGEGIFGGEYKYVYYFSKKAPTFISSTNVVTLNLFGILDKSILDTLTAILDKKTTPKPGKPNVKPPKEPLFGRGRTVRPEEDAAAAARGGLINKFKKGFGQYFVLEWDFLDESERQIDTNSNTVLEVPGLNSVAPSLVQVVNGLRLIINPDLLG